MLRMLPGFLSQSLRALAGSLLTRGGVQRHCITKKGLVHAFALGCLPACLGLYDHVHNLSLSSAVRCWCQFSAGPLQESQCLISV